MKYKKNVISFSNQNSGTYIFEVHAASDVGSVRWRVDCGRWNVEHDICVLIIHTARKLDVFTRGRNNYTYTREYVYI